MPSRLTKLVYHLGLAKGMAYYRIVKAKKPASISLPGIQHPILFRGIQSDLNMFDQIFIDHQYKLDISFTPKYILDLGANVGYASIYFANHYPQAKIIALEPEHNNYLAAKKNVEPYPNVQLLEGAVWYKQEAINVTDKGFGEAAFMIEAGEGEHATQAYTIPQLMEKAGTSTIDILKMDIEGAEKEIFENEAGGWIPKCRIIIVETHDRYRKGTSKAIFAEMIKHNFSLELSGENMVFTNDAFEDVAHA